MTQIAIFYTTDEKKKIEDLLVSNSLSSVCTKANDREEMDIALERISEATKDKKFNYFVCGENKIAWISGEPQKTAKLLDDNGIFYTMSSISWTKKQSPF